MSETNWPVIVGATLLPNIGGIAAGVSSKNSIKTWYVNLKKPEWTPPNYVFCPAWTTLYSGIGYASYLVYRDGGGFNGAAKLPLIVYGANLALNWAWTPLFFNLKKVDIAFYEINLVSATAAAAGYLFYKINPIAGALLIPYVLWLGFATALNFRIWKDNPEYSTKITEIKSK